MDSDEPKNTEGDEDALFREAMDDVAPLTPAKGASRLPGPKGGATSAQLRKRDAALGLGETRVDPNFLTLGDVAQRDPLEYLEWKKDGVQHAVYSKLRSGGYPIQSALDLHRKTVKEARQLVFTFLNKASANDWRVVLIASGKGQFSSTPGRLKSYLAHWLEEHPEVIALCSATRQHGGVGAVYALLRKSKQSSELNREQHGGKSDLE